MKASRQHSAWKHVETVLSKHYYQPDLQAARALFSAVAAHDLIGPPVWMMAVAPPGSLKTELVEALRTHQRTFLIDTVTPKTFLSGQIGKQNSSRSQSLLKRIGSDGLIIYPDFSTILEMHRDQRGAVLADMRRIYDGALHKEFGTAEDPQEQDWQGRITFIVAATPVVDQHFKIFQELGERFMMVRWARPGGPQAALCAMQVDQRQARTELREAVEALFDQLPPASVSIGDVCLDQLASLTELVVHARTHVPRDSYSKELMYIPEPEGATRMAQQLIQLAKGSARLDRRVAVNTLDLAIARRVAYDCIPALRCSILTALINGTASPEDLKIPKSTYSYACADMQALGLLVQVNGQHKLAASARALVEQARESRPWLA